MDASVQPILKKCYEALPAVLVLIAALIVWEFVIVVFE